MRTEHVHTNTIDADIIPPLPVNKLAFRHIVQLWMEAIAAGSKVEATGKAIVAAVPVRTL